MDKGSSKALIGAAELASTHRVSEKPLIFVIGSFDSRVTVLSQQTRALNLVWALIETKLILTRSEKRTRIAIVGAGFAGLTVAAGLLQKGASAEIDIFEQRDTLLPLQQGSDSRWLHPRIYDWPADGTEAAAAMLPVLNWTAARSSDVVVQVLGEWSQIAEHAKGVRLFCNARHLQITQCSKKGSNSRIEWVGEQRHPSDGRAIPEVTMQGMSETYDIVIMATGFGLETGKPSYWRNETLGQPGLDEARQTYLLSGQGDGAMIDLMRIRISQFRQDRILDELFTGRQKLVEELRTLRKQFLADNGALFQKFEALAAPESEFFDDMKNIAADLHRRLRRDTDVILRLKVRNIAELLEPQNSRMSFQNALLVFLLYRCGGFSPSTDPNSILRKKFNVAKDLEVQRHGVKPLDLIGKFLPTKAFEEIKGRRETEKTTFGLQSANSHWPGGYFGYEGAESDVELTNNDDRRQWRKEYLPGPTALLATTLCGSVAGAIRRLKPGVKHFRVALHRTMSLNGEDLLQQACDYVGNGLEESSATAGRTMRADALTIGVAYQTRQVVRTPIGVTRQKIKTGMEKLSLRSVARKMMSDVSFVFAMPIVQPDTSYYSPSPVAAVLYLDSRDIGFWLADDEIAELSKIVEGATRAMDAADGASLGRVRNFPLSRIVDAPPSNAAEETGIEALEIVSGVLPPSTIDGFVLNYDYTDLAPVTTRSTTREIEKADV
jgi:hypothetical protein